MENINLEDEIAMDSELAELADFEPEEIKYAVLITGYDSNKNNVWYCYLDTYDTAEDAIVRAESLTPESIISQHKLIPIVQTIRVEVEEEVPNENDLIPDAVIFRKEFTV